MRVKFARRQCGTCPCTKALSEPSDRYDLALIRPPRLGSKPPEPQGPPSSSDVPRSANLQKSSRQKLADIHSLLGLLPDSSRMALGN